MSRPKIEIYEDSANLHRFRVRAGNGEIVLTGESYRDRTDAARGAVDALAAGAEALLELAGLPATAAAAGIAFLSGKRDQVAESLIAEQAD